MTGLVEAVAVKALEATLTSVAKSVGQRLWAGLNPFTARNKKKAQSLASLISTLDFTERVSLLGVLDDLPNGVTLARVERILSSLPVQSVIHELVATHLAQTSEGRKSLVRRNFEMVFAQQLGAASRPESDALSNTISQRIEEGLERVLDEYKSADANGYAQMQTLASSGLVEATLQAIDRHSSHLDRYTNVQNIHALEAWVRDYRHQVAAAHGFISPPDFERKRKIPMDALYVAPKIRSLGRHNSSLEFEIDEFARAIDRTVLLGDPGGGKSTAASYIAYSTSKDVEARLPFVVILREFARDDDIDKSIVKYMEERCETFYQCKSPEGAIEHLLLNGEALVIFDGLDELIDTTKRRQVTEVVELFSARFPLATALVTSRRVGYEQAQLDPRVFSACALGGFEDEDVERYVGNWFSTVEELDGDDLEIACQSFIEESRSVPDLTATPLMLALLCIIYLGQGYIPKNRPAVYESCAVLLFEKWDSSRKIFVGLRAADQVDAAIKHLAYWMLTDQAGAEAVTESELVKEAAEFLGTTFENPRERRRAAEEFVTFCRGRAWVFSDAGTTPDGEALFKFTHRTFMEYFAAYELTRRADGPTEIGKVLLPRIAKAEWDVVGQLAVQISNKHSRDGAVRIFEVLLDDRRKRNDVSRDNIHSFIWRCLTFLPATPTLLRRLVKASVESSFHRRGTGRFYHNADDAPSITRVIDVLPDARAVVSEALLSELLKMTNSPDPARQSYSKIVLISWSTVAGQAQNKDAVVEWTRWTQKHVQLHKDILLSRGPGEKDVWLTALMRGYVSMDEFLDEAANWGGQILDALFTPQQETPLGFSLSDWASRISRLPRFNKGAAGNKGLQKLHIEQLRQLGARLPADMDRPFLDWSNVQMPFRGALHSGWMRTVDSDVENADVIWATWAIFACMFETMGEFYFNTRRRRHEDIDELIAKVHQSRSGGGPLPADFFKDTMFAGLTGDRQKFRDAWVRGEINLVRNRLRLPK